jgi:hypothetical protein|tara:strand:+ start:1155 stop:1874 length:720 start_codon:yes stop_codon:yes gene_type:complete
MSKPTIIGTGTNTKGYTPTSNANSTNRTFTNIAIPANANTVFLQVGFDSALNSRNITDVSLSGISGHVELLNVDPTPNEQVKITRFIALDTSACSASTVELQMTLSSASSGKAVLGVVCTDGFIQNVTLTQDRLMEFHKLMVHQDNSDNTTLVSMAIMDEDTTDLAFSGTGVAQLYKVDETTVNCYAHSQSTVSADGFMTIIFESDDNADDIAHAILLLTSQLDPFDGLTGKLTSPVVK